MSGAGERFLPVRPGRAVARRELPRLEFSLWREAFLEETRRGARISALFALPRPGAPEAFDLIAVLLRPAGEGAVEPCVAVTETGTVYPALTPDCPQAHWFEREIAEQWGVRPEGHPWLKPIRCARSWNPERDAWSRPPGGILPGVFEPYCVEGGDIHEVAVGPVHAGVIEPGHFRFQCYGERVGHLEITLGYQHRGVARALRGSAPGPRAMALAETLAGDTTIGHAVAWCEAVEALAGAEAPPRARLLRAIALELERLANHTGDLGALANDVGFLPTSSFCGRLRGDFLNLTALLCGNRFGRGFVRPGGTGFDLEPERIEKLRRGLEITMRGARGAIDLLWTTPSVIARFEGTGAVSRETAGALGLVGPAARACGLARDLRAELLDGKIRPVLGETGDVDARARVRAGEIRQSGEWIAAALDRLPEGPARAAVPASATAPDSFVVTFAEGWRGEICHVALTGADGRFEACKIVDPSFHNWIGLAMALRGQEISDFPLCNKSFNLSYCGHDL